MILLCAPFCIRAFMLCIDEVATVSHLEMKYSSKIAAGHVVVRQYFTLVLALG
jgi:hypothetical protein